MYALPNAEAVKEPRNRWL